MAGHGKDKVAEDPESSPKKSIEEPKNVLSQDHAVDIYLGIYAAI